MSDNLDSALRAEALEGFFRSWVGTAVFCRSCGGVLDYRDAVLAGATIVCGTCYDKFRARFVEMHGEAEVARAERERAATADFVDGRTFDGGKYAAKRNRKNPRQRARFYRGSAGID